MSRRRPRRQPESSREAPVTQHLCWYRHNRSVRPEYDKRWTDCRPYGERNKEGPGPEV